MPEVGELEVRAYREADRAAVVRMWERAGVVSSAGDHAFDIREKLAVQRELFLVGTLDGRVVATAMAGYDGHRGWLYRVAVDPDLRRRGLGGRMVAAAEARLRAAGCSKVNLQVRAEEREAVRFWEALGFSAEDRVSMGKRLSEATDEGATPEPAAAAGHFGDRLMGRVRKLGHPLCVGLDPHLELIPPPFRRGSMDPRSPQSAVAVEEFLVALVDLTAGRAAAFKPQSAFFERLGARGAEVLGRVVARARERGVPVLLDAKRGDIGSTATAYADAYLGPLAPIRVDAITVNPYLGSETLQPFVERAEEGGGGVFVLTKTSNPGSAELQDLPLAGRTLFERVAEALCGVCARLAGPATGWSSLGVVVGATMPEHAVRVRERLPRAPFLVPGYGAQGGSTRGAVAGFVAGPDGALEGGIVSSSRGLAFPAGAEGAGAWERGVEAAFDRAIDELGAVLRD